MTIADLRQMIADEAARHQPPPPPAITLPAEPELKPTSPGGGKTAQPVSQTCRALLRISFTIC